MRLQVCYAESNSNTRSSTFNASCQGVRVLKPGCLILQEMPASFSSERNCRKEGVSPVIIQSDRPLRDLAGAAKPLVTPGCYSFYAGLGTALEKVLFSCQSLATTFCFFIPGDSRLNFAKMRHSVSCIN